MNINTFFPEELLSQLLLSQRASETHILNVLVDIYLTTSRLCKYPPLDYYSPKWWWIVEDIYLATSRLLKYPPLSPTLMWITVLVYVIQVE